MNAVPTIVLLLAVLGGSCCGFVLGSFYERRSRVGKLARARLRILAAEERAIERIGREREVPSLRLC